MLKFEDIGMLDVFGEVLKAQERIYASVRETPLDFALSLSKSLSLNLYLKCEHLQHTGSFKVRGALNALLSLKEKQKQKGVVVASTGNFGSAIAYGLSRLNIPGIIFVPENASLTKVENIRNYNTPLQFHGVDCVEAELYARDYAKQNDMLYISPYNHRDVIAGQGTVGFEILKQLDAIDVVFVSVGGGGLISGIAGFIKKNAPHIKIVGCLPENSPVMAQSIKVKKIIELTSLPTLSDATAGGIEPNSITFDLCNAYVDDFVLVTESEIQSAVLWMLKTQHQLIEGAAGVALASVFQCAKQYKNKNVVVVLSGSNISFETLKYIIEYKNQKMRRLDS